MNTYANEQLLVIYDIFASLYYTLSLGLFPDNCSSSECF